MNPFPILKSIILPFSKLLTTDPLGFGVYYNVWRLVEFCLPEEARLLVVRGDVPHETRIRTVDQQVVFKVKVYKSYLELVKLGVRASPFPSFHLRLDKGWDVLCWANENDGTHRTVIVSVWTFKLEWSDLPRRERDRGKYGSWTRLRRRRRGGVDPESMMRASMAPYPGIQDLFTTSPAELHLQTLRILPESQQGNSKREMGSSPWKQRMGPKREPRMRGSVIQIFSPCRVSCKKTFPLAFPFQSPFCV